MSSPQENAIPLPYTSRLLSEMQPGQTLVVRGDVLPGAKRFEVNFLNDSLEINPSKGSVPLHISVRFDEGEMVLNSLQGEWGKEERHSNCFKPGQPFDLRIRVHDDKYEISCDQKKCCDYKHRQPIESIDHLQVNGDVKLAGVHWGGRYFVLPFDAPFHGNQLRQGQRVHVHGVPKGDFSVNFVDVKGNMVFHFNPRFSEKAVVRNGQSAAGEWGNEEREGKFPFQENTGFDLVVHNEPYSIQVFVNGDRFCTFAHRADPFHFKGISVQGELELIGLEVSH